MYFCFVLLWILSLLLMVAATLWLVALSARLWWFLNPLVLLFFGLCLGGAGFFLLWVAIHNEMYGSYKNGLVTSLLNLLWISVVAYLVVAIFGNWRVEGKSRAARWPLGRLTLVLLGVAGILSGYVGWLYQRESAAIADVDKKALEEIEVLFKPKKSPDENAALLYKAAFLLSPNGTWPKEVQELSTFLNSKGKLPEDFAADDPVIVKHVDAMALCAGTIRNIAALPYYCPKYDPKGFLGDAIESRHVDNLTVTLLLDERVAMSRGDTKLAMENLLALFRLADHVGQVPKWMEQSTSRQLSLIAFQELEHLFANYSFDDESLKILAQWMPTPRWQQMPNIFRHQSPIDIHQMLDRRYLSRVAPVSSSAEGLERLAAEIPAKIFYLPSDLKNYQDYSQFAQTSKPLPHYSNVRQIDALERTWRDGPRGVVFTAVGVSPQEVFAEAATHDAVNQLSLIAVAMHRYRIAKGVFPDSLTELKEMFPEVDTVDPFQGKSFRFLKRSNDRVTLRCGSPYGEAYETETVRKWSELYKAWGNIDIKLVAVDAPPTKSESAESPAEGASGGRGSDGP